MPGKEEERWRSVGKVSKARVGFKKAVQLFSSVKSQRGRGAGSRARSSKAPPSEQRRAHPALAAVEGF